VKTFTVGESPRLEVRLQSGRLTIEVGPPGRIDIELVGSDSDDVVITGTGDMVTVANVPGFARWGKSVTVRAIVPKGCALGVGGAALDVAARGVLGRTLVALASGDLDMEAVAALDAKSASGDISVESCAGRCRVTSASGDLRLGRIDEDLTASTASGDVRADRVGGTAEVRTASGAVSLNECCGPVISVKSLSGDISVGIPGGRRVEADMTTLSGSVHLPEKRGAGAVANQVVRLQVRSVSGDIEVRRA
jgi:hypothetical protein